MHFTFGIQYFAIDEFIDLDTIHHGSISLYDTEPLSLSLNK